MMKNRFLHILVLMVLPLMVLSQNVEFEKGNFKNDKRGLKEALLDYEDGDYFYSLSPENATLALSYYLKAYEFNPNNATLCFKIGLCYLESRDMDKSMEFFDKAEKLLG